MDSVELNTTDTPPPKESPIKMEPRKKFQINKKAAEIENERKDIVKLDKRFFVAQPNRITEQKINT